MKKRGAWPLTLLVALSMALSLAACGGEKDTVDAAAATEGSDARGTPAFVTEEISGPDDPSPSRDMGSGTAFLPWAEAGLEDHVMEWNDESLEGAMRYFTGIAEGDIMLSDVWELTEFRLDFVPDKHLLQISNIEALGELTNLVGIHMDWQPLSDITPLAKLTNLQYLILSRTDVTDVTPLAGLTNLTDLDLSGDQIGDLSPISGLTNLKNLYLMGCNISDIGPLGGLTNLTILYMSDNSIADAGSLAGLTELRTLDLGNNQISDVGPLSELKKLETLFLGGNSISDVGPLSGLTGLTSMSLDSNSVSDISPLSGLSNLGQLILHGNPIRDVTPVSFVPSLFYDEFTEPQPAEPQPSQNSGAAVSLADYVGTYTPYPAYSAYSGGGSVTLDASGVFMGGETNGRTPSSVSPNADGSITILFGPDERYIIYPVGVPTPSYIQNVNASEVNIEYLYTGGGALDIVYHAAPASLGIAS